MKLNILFVVALAFVTMPNVGITQTSDDETAPLIPAVPVAVREVTPLGTAFWKDNDTLLLARVDRQSEGSNIVLEVWQPFIDPVSTFVVTHQSHVDEDEIGRLAFNPDGTRLAGLSFDHLDVFDTDTGQRLFTTEGAPVGFLSWSPDGTQFAVQSRANYYSFDLIDAQTGQRTKTYRLFDGARTRPGSVIYNVSWGSTSEVTVIAADNRRALIDLSTNADVDIGVCCIDGAYELEWQPNGRLLATHDRIVDAYTGEVVFSYPEAARTYWSPDGNWLVGAFLTDLSLISPTERRVVLRFSTVALGDSHIVTDVAWSAGNARLAIFTQNTDKTGNYYAWVSVWDVSQLLSLASSVSHESP